MSGDSEEVTQKVHWLQGKLRTFPLIAFLGLIIAAAAYGFTLLRHPDVEGSVLGLDLQPSDDQRLMAYTMMTQLLSDAANVSLRKSLISRLHKIGAEQVDIDAINKAAEKGSTTINFDKLKPYQQHIAALAFGEVQSELYAEMQKNLSKALTPVIKVLVFHIVNRGNTDAKDFRISLHADAYIEGFEIESADKVVSKSYSGQDGTVEFTKLSPGASVTGALWLKALSGSSEKAGWAKATWDDGYLSIEVVPIGPGAER